MNKPFYSLDRAGADGFQMKNGGTLQTSAGLFTRFDERPSHILEIPPRLVDVFPRRGAVSGEGASICLANNGVVAGDTRGLGRKCSSSVEIQSESGGCNPLRESGASYDLHRAAIFHECETMALVERRVLLSSGITSRNM